jgi:hypothetical protein
MHASQNFVTDPARQTFASDWHPHLGEALAGFPRCVALPAEAGGELCWPDFATLIEDSETRQMMYYPMAASEFSAHVLFDDDEAAWHVQFYSDDEPLLACG